MSMTPLEKPRPIPITNPLTSPHLHEELDTFPGVTGRWSPSFPIKKRDDADDMFCSPASDMFHHITEDIPNFWCEKCQ